MVFRSQSGPTNAGLGLASSASAERKMLIMVICFSTCRRMGGSLSSCHDATSFVRGVLLNAHRMGDILHTQEVAGSSPAAPTT